jgi:hypothetical protein
MAQSDVCMKYQLLDDVKRPRGAAAHPTIRQQR